MTIVELVGSKPRFTVRRYMAFMVAGGNLRLPDSSLPNKSDIAVDDQPKRGDFKSTAQALTPISCLVTMRGVLSSGGFPSGFPFGVSSDGCVSAMLHGWMNEVVYMT